MDSEQPRSFFVGVGMLGDMRTEYFFKIEIHCSTTLYSWADTATYLEFVRQKGRAQIRPHRAQIGPHGNRNIAVDFDPCSGLIW